MATTKRKTTRGSGGGKRSRAAGSRGSGGRRKAAERPIRREAAGCVFLLLALFTGISYFQGEALLLGWISALFRGLTGWGYYVMLPAMLLSAWILLLHRGREVTVPLTGALLLPLLCGSVVHMLRSAQTAGSAAELWRGGLALTSGGVLSGGLAVGSLAVIGKIASLILFFAAILGCVMAALRLTPAAVVDYVRSRELLPYDEEDYESFDEEPEEEPQEPPAKKRRAASIDIPLDGEERPEPKRKSGFFAPKDPKVRTPDEVLEKPEPQIIIASPPPTDKPVGTAGAGFSAEAVKKPARLAPIEPPKPAEKTEKAKESEVERAASEVAAEIEAAEAEEAEYSFPPMNLLTAGTAGNAEAAGAELRSNSQRLAETLKSFGVDAVAGDVVRGPSVTRYEFALEQGVKLSKITNLQDDIALALGATGVRVAPIPDKLSVVGIEVPNRQVTPVHIRDVLESPAFAEHKSSVCFSVGKDINGNAIVGDIARFPHVLIAGTTGSGKSVCTNSLIVSMLYKSTPENVRFIMVDPKMVELAPYNGIPHLLIPVVTDPKKAAGALQWAVYEMMKRYKDYSAHGVKDLAAYNALAATDPTLKHQPTIVVVIDELADLMLVAAKEVEESICRVAQMGRAAGMHLVIATQSPRADVITGLMKANIPSRIAFAVASSLESRIILDTVGAEKLVGKGDMLYAPIGMGKPLRVQGCFISAEEIERVVSFVKENGEASYDKDVIEKIEQNVAEKERGSGKSAPAAEEPPAAEAADEMLSAAIEVVLETGQASTSLLQRRLKLGYSRAARIVDQMEERGIIGGFEGSKPRQLLITREQWEELKMKGQSAPAAAGGEEQA